MFYGEILKVFHKLSACTLSIWSTIYCYCGTLFMLCYLAQLQKGPTVCDYQLNK